ncbi:MAG TPA: hypothetical protein VLU54_17840 [Casimicrobiaceae bacterium]|nr:hypothetical protein [Casimicrobiaceae bacterium]
MILKGCRLVAAVVLAAGLAGCAATGQPPGGAQLAEAPKLEVGARWVYRGQDGFRTPDAFQETIEVTAVGPAGAEVSVTRRGSSGDFVRRETWAAPGLVLAGSLTGNETLRFSTPLERYRFPLYTGQTWNQWIDSYNETARKAERINHYVRVGRWEKVSTPAGAVDAIRLRVLMQLGDEEFWRHQTMCNYLIWYAPAVGAAVREEKDCEYLEKGSRDGTTPVRTQHAVLELIAYTPGRP